MQSIIFYTLKIWLTSLIVGSFVLGVIETIDQNAEEVGSKIWDWELFISFFGLAVFYGGILSFLNWIIFTVLIWILTSFSSNKSKLKTIFSILGVLLTFGLFFLLEFQRNHIWIVVFFPFIYSVMVIISVWYYDFILR